MTVQGGHLHNHQYGAHNQLTSFEHNRLYHKVTTSPGQSGSPILIDY